MKKSEAFIAYEGNLFSVEESIQRSRDHYQFMDKRRSIRDFSDKPVPKEIIDNILRTASSAPSGAHKQPWVFCVISNTTLKHRIRELAEAEEKRNYESRMSERWLKDLEIFGTNEVKEFIDIAPWIVVVMKKTYDYDSAGNKTNNYYSSYG